MATLTITQGALNLACMGDPSETVEGPTLDGTPLADVVQLARSARVTVIDRGNRARTLVWKVKRKPAASAVQALFAALQEEFNLEASSGLPIVLSYGMPGGMVLTVSDGALTHHCEHSGKMAVHEYRLSFGQGAVANFDAFALIEGVTPFGATARIVTTGASYWLQLLDSATNQWTTVWLNNGALTTGFTTPAGTTAARINGGFLQLADVGTGGFRSIWWNVGALQVGPVDNTTADGNPPTAFRLQTTGAGIFAQLEDQAAVPQFRSMVLTGGALTAGPLVS
jgi:hypothetical protein